MGSLERKIARKQEKEAKKLEKEEILSMNDRIQNLIQTKEQLEASLFKIMGAIEFAESLERVRKEEENAKK